MPDLKETTLRDSKLYELGAKTPFLEFLKPDEETQKQVYDQLLEKAPRDLLTDGLDTRIFINYRNARNKSILYTYTDHERLDKTTLDIDDFLDGYLKNVPQLTAIEDPLMQINWGITLSLTDAVNTLLGFNEGNVSEATKHISKIFLQAIVAIVFDDPKDVFISLQDPDPKTASENDHPRIVAIWMMEARPKIVEVDGVESLSESDMTTIENELVSTLQTSTED